MSKSRDYELFVASIMKALLNAQGLETVEVKHDVQVQGTSRSHQVDVYWEYRLGGLLHRVVINCKNYGRTVAVTDVLTLNGVLQDMPGVRGVVVTTVGFQKGAVEYAKTHQIGLKVIRPPEAADWEGRIRQINVRLHINVPELIGCDVRLDETWYKEHVGEPGQNPIASLVARADTTVVRDLDTGDVSDMNQLWNRAMSENPTEPGQEGHGALKWKNAMIETDGGTALKVIEIEFHWKIHPSDPHDIVVKRDPTAIVRDAVEGTLLFVDDDGRIGGDVGPELGRNDARH